jgi:hypothetical protein
MVLESDKSSRQKLLLSLFYKNINQIPGKLKVGIGKMDLTQHVA